MRSSAPCTLRTRAALGAVNLDDVLLGDLLINEKLRHHLALVALQLDDLAQVRVLHQAPVAVELLLALLQDGLLVDLRVDALQGRQ